MKINSKLLTLLFVVGILNSSSASIIKVGSSWTSQDYNTISLAITNADSGDQIWVAKGTYTENLTLTNGIQLYGGFEGDETSIDQRELWNQNFSHYRPKTKIDATGGDSSRCIWAESSTIIDGFELMNGENIFGSGISIYNASNIEIRNIYFYNGDSEAEDDSVGWGGGIYIRSNVADTVLLERSVVWQCAAWCGAVEIADTSSTTLIVKHCTIVGNDAFGLEVPSTWDTTATIIAPNHKNHSFYNNIILDNENTRGENLVTEYGHDVWAWSRDFTEWSYIGEGDWDSETGNSGWGTIKASNITEDSNGQPQFINPDFGNFRLLSNSPCIEAGKDDSTMGAYYYEASTISEKDDLLAQWTFNGNSIDSSGHGHHGTRFNDATYDTTSKEGDYSLGLLADGAYVDTDSINTGNQFTVAGWVKIPQNRDDTYNIQTVLANTIGGSSGNGFKIFVNTYNPSSNQNPDKRVYVETIDSGGNQGNVKTAVNAFPFGEWNHIAVTMNRTGGEAKIYVNGSRADSGSLTIQDDFQNEDSLSIGKMRGNGGYPLNGYIDDLRVYDKLLSTSEIADLAGQDIVEYDTLIARWQFEENLKDSSGFENHGQAAETAVYEDTNIKEGEYSLELDGSDDYVSIDNFNLGDSSLTFMAWVKIPSNRNNIQTVLANTESGDTKDGFKLFVNTYNENEADGKIHLETGNGTSFEEIVSAENVFNFGDWNHIAVTLDHCNNAKNAILYLNGDSLCADTVLTGFNRNTTLYIGQMSNDVFRLAGNIDDLRIYTKALSAEEIEEIVGVRPVTYDTLIAKWQFENNLNDSSGFNNHGQAADTTYEETDIKEGEYSLELDGSDDYVSVANFNLGDSSLSITAWVYIPADAAQTCQTVIANAPTGGNSNGVKFFVNSWGENDRAIYLETGNGSQSEQVITADYTFQFNTWNHLAATIDYQEEEGIIYLNGSEVKRDDIRVDFNRTNTFHIGQMTNNYCNLEGFIDDLRIYSKALSANEIAAIAGVDSETGDSTLIAYWPFDNSSTDNSGNEHDGTLYDNAGYIDGTRDGSYVLDLDGTDDYIDVGTIDLGDSSTIACWIKIPSNTSGIQTIIANAPASSNNSNGLKLYVNSDESSDGKVHLETQKESNKNWASTSAGSFKFGSWNHIAVTIAQDSSQAKIYVNGIKATVDSLILGEFKTDTLVHIGQFISGDYELTGSIDDLKIYNQCLSDSMIAELAYQDTLMVQWLFNGNAEDNTENKFNGTGHEGAYYSNATTLTRDGSQVLVLDGSNDYVDVGVIDFGDSSTIAGWVKIPSNTSSIQPIIANAPASSSNSNGFKLYVNTYNSTDGRVIFETQNGDDNTQIKARTDEDAFTFGSWNHIAVTIAHDNGQVQLYVNGIKATVDSLIRDDYQTDAPAHIGQFYNGGFNLNGNIDDLRIYRKCLSAATIAQLAQSDTLIAQWLFNNDANDNSGNGFTSSYDNVSFSDSDKKEGSHSLQLDGSEDQIVRTNAEVDLGDNATITAWVKIPSNTSNIRTVIANVASGDTKDGFKLFVNTWNQADGKIHLETGDGASCKAVVSDSGVFDFGNWNHIAVTLDRSNGNGAIYLDGTKIKTGEIHTDFKKNDTLYVSLMADTSFHLTGNIDDLRIYGDLLSDSEIAAVANEYLGKGRPKEEKQQVAQLPGQFLLFQNYPNPFNPTTNIKFDLPEAANVVLEIYNIMGQKVKTVLNTKLAAGHHSLIWNTQDNWGRHVSSGVYFYRIQIEGTKKIYVKTRKMLLLK